MTVRAACIGINQYVDPDIRDLAGARRDATTLWALVADSVAGSKPQLVTDGDATLHNVRRAMDETLGAADPEDAVILLFAGHGTQDHRLVLHDTSLTDLDVTTLPMAELAQRFKSSKAKTV